MAGALMSGKFRFRLAPVLRVARLREDAERGRLATAAAEEVAANRRRLERVAAYDALPPAGAGSAADFEAGRDIADLRARAVTDADAARRDASDRLAVAREEWLRASRRVKSLEELEDRHHAAHAMAAARAAQRSLDDLARTRNER
jgi:flagellar export protein FliJ